MPTPHDSASSLSRRRFLRATAGGVALSTLPIERFAHAAQGGPLKLGLIGGGGRGTGAANQALKSIPNIQLVAMGELFQDIADKAVKNLAASNSTKVDVTPDRSFLGFDAYKKVIAACDVVVV